MTNKYESRMNAYCDLKNAKYNIECWQEKGFDNPDIDDLLEIADNCLIMAIKHLKKEIEKIEKRCQQDEPHEPTLDEKKDLFREGE